MVFEAKSLNIKENLKYFVFQARKSEEDVAGICEMCDKLRVSQIIKILNLYTPADEFEERVSPAFVRKIQSKLQDRSMEEAKNQVFFYFNCVKFLSFSPMRKALQ